MKVPILVSVGWEWHVMLTCSATIRSPIQPPEFICVDVESTSMTLMQRHNNVCPVGYIYVDPF